MQESDDLNDLRLVAMIGRHGSLAGAARALGVNHATVFRRLNHIEKKLGVRLFERKAGRYAATVAGEALMEAGEHIAETANQALLKVAGEDQRPQGLVRITTTDSFSLSLLPSILARCRQQFPLIRLQLDVDNRAADLSRRDADIAIRPTLRPPDHLIGKSLGALPFAIYAARGCLHASSQQTLAQRTWIALDDRYTGHASLRWLATLCDVDSVALRCSSFGGARDACRAGIGLAVLPVILGARDPALVRIGAPISECSSAVWLLKHPDLRKATRIKAVFDFLHAELGAAIQDCIAAD